MHGTHGLAELLWQSGERVLEFGVEITHGVVLKQKDIGGEENRPALASNLGAGLGQGEAGGELEQVLQWFVLPAVGEAVLAVQKDAIGTAECVLVYGCA